MKKVFLISILAAISFAGFSQTSFGVQAGGSLGFGKASTDFSIPGFPTALTNDPKFGFFAGFLAEIPLGEKLAFRPELNFVQKGSESTVFSTVQNKLTLNYAELPLNVVYKLPVGSGNFFFGLGPALAFGISGKGKLSDPSDPNDPDNNRTADVNFDGKKSDDVPATDRDIHLNRFDLGANIIAGYKLPMGIFFKLGYTHGLMEVDPNDENALPDDRSSYKNRAFSIGIGYMFGGNNGADN